MAVGVLAPIVRRRVRVPPAAVITAVAATPAALTVAVPRSRARDVAVCALNMYAYHAIHEMPYDDPQALTDRTRIDYPIRIDRALGLGTLPSVLLQSKLSRPERVTRVDKILIWSHWAWFAVPHTALAYLLVRRPSRFAHSATLVYAVFDLGCVVYWALPTAPPWYAAERGRMDGATPRLRRVMLEYGEQFWADRWGPLYAVLGGNPLAAMPSLHFATSLMAAHVLTESGGPVVGTVAWTYTFTLGIALVYLGEHYVTDLLAGTALTEGILLAAPRAAPALGRASGVVSALGARAQAG